MSVPTLSDVRAYIGASSQSDDAINDALAAETAAQATRCRIPVLFPDDLRQALLRRVQRNLALRSLPLGLTEASGDSVGSSYVPGNDPEIRRLEAPWRRLVVG